MAETINERIAQLKHNDVAVRTAAAESLGKSGDPRALDALKAALTSYGFMRVGKTRAVNAAISMLTSRNDDERYWAAEILSALKDSRASAGLLIAQAHETSIDARRSMRLALSGCGTADALPALTTLAAHPDENLRTAAASAAAAIRQRQTA